MLTAGLRWLTGRSFSDSKQGEMSERRKTPDRRNKLPKEALPLYYTRRIPDRRQGRECHGEDAADGVEPASQLEAGDRSEMG